MKDVVKECPRETEVVDDVDLLVVGGGPAGIAASIAAARDGARTLLVERYAYLGGMATGGLVIAWPGFGREGSLAFGGIAFAIERRLHDQGLTTYRPHGELEMAYHNPEMLKVLALEMCEEAGVRFRFHSFCVDVVMDHDRIAAVIFESKAGRQAIRAKRVIDATGDADVAARAGAPCVVGHMHQMDLRDMSFCLRIGNVDEARSAAAFKAGGEALERRLKGLVDNAFWLQCQMPDPGTAWSMALDYFKADCLSIDDLTRVSVDGLKKAAAVFRFYKENVGGFEEAFLMQTNDQAAVRASRQIVGDYVFTEKDAESGRRFDDAIGRGDNCSKAVIFDIPYRTLIPKKVENLLVAGRCISAETPRGMHKIRPIGHCFTTGEAAGCAAALSVESNRGPRNIDRDELQKRLKGHGVNL